MSRELIVVLCFIRGLVGVVVGVIASLIVNATLTHIALDITVIMMAVGFAVAVRLFFGIYPARRASRLSPIDALRYE